MARAACTCRYERLWHEPHRKGCPRHVDHGPARKVKRVVMRRHPSTKGEWMAWPECWSIDVFAMRFWPSGVGHLRVAYEVKVARSDLLAELRNPGKRLNALDLSHEFYFATSPGLVRPGELPEECGLVEVRNGRSRVVVAAPRREPRPLADEEWRYLLRRDLFRDTQPLLRRIALLEQQHARDRARLESRDEELRQAHARLAKLDGVGPLAQTRRGFGVSTDPDSIVWAEETAR